MTKAIKQIIVLFLLIKTNLFAQNQVDNDNGHGIGLDVGYSYCKASELTGGVSYLFYTKTDYKKTSLFEASLNGQLLIANKAYGGLKLSAGYLFLPHNSLGFQLDISGTTNRLIDFGLDASAGLNYGGVYYIFYGYNFYRQKPSDQLARHSIGIFFRLNWAILDLQLLSY